MDTIKTLCKMKLSKSLPIYAKDLGYELEKVGVPKVYLQNRAPKTRK